MEVISNGKRMHGKRGEDEIQIKSKTEKGVCLFSFYRSRKVGLWKRGPLFYFLAIMSSRPLFPKEKRRLSTYEGDPKKVKRTPLQSDQGEEEEEEKEESPKSFSQRLSSGLKGAFSKLGPVHPPSSNSDYWFQRMYQEPEFDDDLKRPLSKTVAPTPPLTDTSFLDDETMHLFMDRCNAHSKDTFFFHPFYFNGSFHYSPNQNPDMAHTDEMGTSWPSEEWRKRLTRLKKDGDSVLSLFQQGILTRFFFPINHGGHAHWLALLINFKAQTCTYIDSYPQLSQLSTLGGGTFYDMRIAYFKESLYVLDSLYREKDPLPVEDEIDVSRSLWEQEWSVEKDWEKKQDRRWSPPQKDGFSCGDHILLAACALSLHPPPFKTPLFWPCSLLQSLRSYLRFFQHPPPLLPSLPKVISSPHVRLFEDTERSYPFPTFTFVSKSQYRATPVVKPLCPPLRPLAKGEAVLYRVPKTYVKNTSLSEWMGLGDRKFSLAIILSNMYDPFLGVCTYDLFTPFGLLKSVSGVQAHMLALHQEKIKSYESVVQLTRLCKTHTSPTLVVDESEVALLTHYHHIDSSFLLSCIREKQSDASFIKILKTFEANEKEPDDTKENEFIVPIDLL